jgi:hypothetical protein
MTKTRIIKIATLLLLLTLLPINIQAYFTITNVPDISLNPDGNSVNEYTLPPGAVFFTTHQSAGAGDANMVNGFDNFVRENSYGRNFFVANYEDCTTYYGGSSACTSGYITNGNSVNLAVDYNISCSPNFCGWDYSCMVHETGHCFGFGEGFLVNDTTTPYQIIDKYGDKYDPEGIGTGSGLNGHWCSPNKESAGFIGVNGYRPLLLATNGILSYYITDINSQSAGPKALKVLRNRNVIYRTDALIYQDKREFYYLEVRPNHYFGTTSTGKGKKRRTTSLIAPAVQVRLGTPFYLKQPNGYRIQSALVSNIGSKGGLKAGQGFTFQQTTSARVTYDGPITTFIKTVTITIVSVDSLGAVILVSIQ